MNKTIKTLILIILIVIIYSCSLSEKAIHGNKLRISVQAGSNFGGITENTDLSIVPGVKVPPEASADAFSGATRPGFNAGVHFNHKLKSNQLEIGIDYMYNHHIFNYIDAGNKYIGVRDLYVSQLIFPFTYNIVLFKKHFPKAEIQIKAGLISQLNYIAEKGTGILPDYSVYPISAGPTLGFSVYPFNLKKGNKVGIYLDIYRGSQIFEDFYNQHYFEIPGSSFARFGLRYQF